MGDLRGVSHEIVDAVSTALCGLLESSLMLTSNGLEEDSSKGISRSTSSRCTEAADAWTGVRNVWRVGPTTLVVLYPSISLCGVSLVDCVIFLWMLYIGSRGGLNSRGGGGGSRVCSVCKSAGGCMPPLPAGCSPSPVASASVGSS